MNSWKFKWKPRNSYEFMGVHVNSCEFMCVHGCSWVFMGVHGCSWVFMWIHVNSCVFVCGFSFILFFLFFFLSFSILLIKHKNLAGFFFLVHTIRTGNFKWVHASMVVKNIFVVEEGNQTNARNYQLWSIWLKNKCLQNPYHKYSWICQRIQGIHFSNQCLNSCFFKRNFNQ